MYRGENLLDKEIDLQKVPFVFESYNDDTFVLPARSSQ